MHAILPNQLVCLSGHAELPGAESRRNDWILDLRDLQLALSSESRRSPMAHVMGKSFTYLGSSRHLNTTYGERDATAIGQATTESGGLPGSYLNTAGD